MSCKIFLKCQIILFLGVCLPLDFALNICVLLKRRFIKGGGMNWEIRIDISTIDRMHKITHERLLHSTGDYSVLCGDLNGKEIQKSGDMCIYTTDSLCCTADTDTALQSNCTSKKIN